MIYLLLFISLLITCYSQSRNSDLRLLESNSTNNPIIIKLNQLQNNVYSFNVSVGTPKQFFSVVYDMFSNESYFISSNCTGEWCADKKFDKNNSTTNSFNMTTLSKTFSNGNLTGIIDADIINFGQNSTSTGAGFILADNSTIKAKYSGLISFGYNYSATYDSNLKTSINMNILDTLNISKKVITQRIFNKSGYLYIGDYVGDIDRIDKNYTKCTIPNNSKGWSCEISSIFLGEFDPEKIIDLNNNSIAYFSTLNYYVVAPSYVSKNFTFLPNCTNSSFEGLTRYTCQNNFNQSVYLGLNNTAYLISSSDLFSQNEDKYNFNILFRNENDNSNDWIVGQLLLKNYDMVFDFENKEIVFNGGSKKDIKKISPVLMFIIIGIAALIVILTSIFVSCYCCKKSEDNEDKQNLI